MKKHFCTCPSPDCPHHPNHHDKGCDDCIEKNLKEGEIPACFWMNVTEGVEGTTEYSVENFVAFYQDHKSKKNRQIEE